MTRPFFSIVMPAYNCEKTILKTVKSLQLQTWPDFECIIVDDGSIDDTRQVIDSIALADERFKAISKKNGGPGSARNEGIKQARGQYLYLMDADDELPPQALVMYASSLKQHDPDLIVSAYELHVMDGDHLVEKREVQVKDAYHASHEEFLSSLHELLEKQLMYVIWNKVYKLDIIKEKGISFPPYSSCEDRLFNLQYYREVGSCLVLSDVLYHYSFDGRNSLTNKFLENKFETFEEFYQTLLMLTEKNHSISSALFLKGTMSCIIPLHSRDCPYSISQKRRKIKEILKHPSVRKASQDSARNSLMRKVMAALFKSRSVSLNFSVSFLMFYISQLSPKLIEKLKGNF